MRSTATNLTALSRRGFLAALGGLAAGPAFAASPLAASLTGRQADTDTPLFASAYRQENGDYGIGIVDDLGQILARISLPGRGHGIAVSPDKRRFVAFARRPGTFAVVVRPYEAAAPLVLSADPGRHFYGHGCFSADGRLLYAVENDFEAARGVLGVYDASGADIRRLGEIATGGVGPHDLMLAKDGLTLVVANGGIRTHPAQPREKLNLDTMAPSVVFLDSDTGDMLAQHALDPALHRLSLRHMALDARGRAWVGGQFEGPESETPPLVGIFSRDKAPELTGLPTAISSDLRNYIGSVTANASGQVIATSAPRGGRTLFWNAVTGGLLGSQVIPDGCGIAPIDQGSFLISDGNGALSLVDHPGGAAEVLARPPGVSWDNHLFSLS